MYTDHHCNLEHCGEEAIVERCNHFSEEEDKLHNRNETVPFHDEMYIVNDLLASSYVYNSISIVDIENHLTILEE